MVGILKKDENALSNVLFTMFTFSVLLFTSYLSLFTFKMSMLMSRFSLFTFQLSLLVYRFSLFAYQLPLLVYRFSLFMSWFSLFANQLLLLVYRFSLFMSWFSLFANQLLLMDQNEMFQTIELYLIHINGATKSQSLEVSLSKFNSNLVFLCVLVPLWPRPISISDAFKQLIHLISDSERIDPQHRIIGTSLVLLIKLVRGIDDPVSIDDKLIGIFSGLKIKW